jgi:hypothetical protein
VLAANKPTKTGSYSAITPPVEYVSAAQESQMRRLSPRIIMILENVQAGLSRHRGKPA